MLTPVPESTSREHESPCTPPPNRLSFPGAATMEFRPGSPDGRAPATDYAAAIRRGLEARAAAGTGEPTVSRHGASGVFCASTIARS